MGGDLDRLLAESLFLDASEALTEIGLELAAFRDGWHELGACGETVAWLDGLIARLGWWSGRLLSGSHSRGDRAWSNDRDDG